MVIKLQTDGAEALEGNLGMNARGKLEPVAMDTFPCSCCPLSFAFSSHCVLISFLIPHFSPFLFFLCSFFLCLSSFWVHPWLSLNCPCYPHLLQAAMDLPLDSGISTDYWHMIEGQTPQWLTIIIYNLHHTDIHVEGEPQVRFISLNKVFTLKL